ncbi:sulfite exporter TauE/SafE family protein [Paraferrimonas sp. SM1919]|uniref:sulfite exporter TauE/SafE family protein n=1 Tax=Paraferrimonas sp. SM1919 TaxID=2662263 RepID=UPI001969B58E|nr:sulfite exporter TauE/SafE family protein [Paraferrimonas sp. SM1919]
MMLAVLFFFVALIYASIGFGGGSSYLALLIMWGVPFAILPVIALSCNISVVVGNSINYYRHQQINWTLFYPLALSSVPMAFIGGLLPISKNLFIWLLAISLLLSGIKLVYDALGHADDIDNIKPMTIWQTSLLGGCLGLLSGMVGIGGGIFLAPILYYLRAGTARHIASTASLFILVNSISGLLGQLTKQWQLQELVSYWPLLIAVIVGGQMGTRLSINWFKPKGLALLTGLLVLFVALRLLLKL